MKTATLCLIAITCITSAALAGRILEDRFTAESIPGRDLSPHRGKWVLKDNIATCTQDDALYKKNKDHGPVIWYRTAFTDATIRFAFKPEAVKSFVFTINDEGGHVFRFVSSPAGLSLRAWPTQGKDAKADALLPRTVKTPPLAEGQWTEVTVTFAGNKATVKIGDFQQTVEHAAIGKKKTVMGLGFSFGTLSVKDVSIETAD